MKSKKKSNESGHVFWFFSFVICVHLALDHKREGCGQNQRMIFTNSISDN